jgi:hypothetical protein
MFKGTKLIALSILLTSGLAACSGGGASSVPGTISLGTNLQPPATAAHTPHVLGSTVYTYTAPWGGFGSPTQIYLNPQGKCSHIPASLAGGYQWPSFLSSLPTGTLVTLTGVPSYGDPVSQQNGCPTGGIVTSNIVIAGASPTPTPMPSPTPTIKPSPTPSPSQTPASWVYVAPWGGFGGGNQIFFNPQGACAHIAATPANGYAWPSFLTGLAPGTTVSVYGTPTYQNNGDKQNNCPTGGIVVTNITLGTASPTPHPSPTPVKSPTPTPTPVPTSTPVSGGCNTSLLSNSASWPASCQFNLNGPWHALVPANPQIVSNSAAVVTNMVVTNGSNPFSYNTYLNPEINSRGGGGYPNYVCQPNSRDCVQVVVNCQGGSGYCSGFNGSGTINGLSMYIPRYALAEGIPDVTGGYTDAHLTNLDCESTPGTCREWDFWQDTNVPPSGGFRSGQTYSVYAGNYSDPIHGDGFRTDIVGGEATVAGNTQLASQVRVAELQNGLYGIQHALQLSAACSNDQNVYPALHPGAFNACTGGNSYNAPPTGAHFYWDESCPTIAQRPLDSMSRAMLCALHTYGGYITDTNGNNAGFQINGAESFQQSVALGYSDFVTPYILTNGTNEGWIYRGTNSYVYTVGMGIQGRLSTQDIQTHFHWIQ